MRLMLVLPSLWWRSRAHWRKQKLRRASCRALLAQTAGAFSSNPNLLACHFTQAGDSFWSHSRGRSRQCGHVNQNGCIPCGHVNHSLQCRQCGKQFALEHIMNLYVCTRKPVGWLYCTCTRCHIQLTASLCSLHCSYMHANLGLLN